MPFRKASAGKKKVEEEIESSPPGQLVPLPSVFNLFPLSRPHDTRTSSTRDSPPSTFPSSFSASLFLSLSSYIPTSSRLYRRIVSYCRLFEKNTKGRPKWKGLRKPRGARVRSVVRRKPAILIVSEKKDKRGKPSCPSFFGAKVKSVATETICGVLVKQSKAKWNSTGDGKCIEEMYTTKYRANFKIRLNFQKQRMREIMEDNRSWYKTLNN